MHDLEKSDSAVVAGKPPNKAGSPAAEAVEPRAGTKGNADQQSTHRTQTRERVTQALNRVRQSARAALRRHTPEVGAGCSESGSSGSVRGASSNGRPYREPRPKADARCDAEINQTVRNWLGRSSMPEIRTSFGGIWPSSVAQRFGRFKAQRRTGRSSGSTRISMLRATPGSA